MTKDIATGLVLRSDLLAWTLLQGGKGQVSVVDYRNLPLEAPVPGEGEVAGGAAEGATRETAATGDGDLAAGAVSVAEQLKAGCVGVKGPVALGLSDDQVLIRVLNLPLAERAELAEMVALQLDKYSPFPVDSMVSGFEVLRTGETGQQVLIAMVRAEFVEAQGAALRAAGVEPARVDAAILGRWRLLQDGGHVRPQGRQIVLVLEQTNCELLLFQDGQPVILRAVNPADPAAGAATSADLVAEVEFALMALDVELGEVAERNLQVWASGEAPPELLSAMRETCGCDVTVHDLAALPPVSEGLARRMLGDVGDLLDLTPVGWRQTETARQLRFRLLLSAAAVMGVWLLAVATLLGGVWYQGYVLRSLRQDLERWTGPAEEVRDIRHRVSVVKQYTDRTHSGLECLREIAVLQPDGVDLTSFTYKKGESVKLTGEAGTVDQVYAFKNKLDSSELYTENVINGPHFERLRGKQVFDMELRLPLAGVTAEPAPGTTAAGGTGGAP